MIYRAFFAAALLVAAALPAAGAERLTVVELFTSQGCPNCPPAQTVLKEIEEGEEGVLALTWPVDYWDFLGWRDTHARPEHSLRQRAYNERFGEPGVYTPQMVIDGRAELIGSRRQEARQTLRRLRAADRPDFEITLTTNGDICIVELPGGAPAEPLLVRAVWYDSVEEAAISGGHNRGLRFAYTNVVKAQRVIGTWSGGKLRLTLSLDEARELGADHLAILLEPGEAGPIYGASSMALGF